jgi:hypothetical protein
MVSPNLIDAEHAMADKPKRKFIKAATANKGALHRHLGVPEGQNIPEDKLRAATHSKDKTIRAEANLAMTLKGLHHAKPKARRAVKDVRRALYGKE